MTAPLLCFLDQECAGASREGDITEGHAMAEEGVYRACPRLRSPSHRSVASRSLDPEGLWRRRLVLVWH